jgi:hypothetical protein
MSKQGKIIACCGYRCDICPAYGRNIHGREDQQQSSDAWFKYSGFRVASDVIHCSGCQSGSALLGKDCPVRPCATQKALSNCGYCQDFPCAKLNTRMNFFDERLRDLSKIPKDDLKRFIKPYVSKNLLTKINTRFKNPRTKKMLLNDIETEYRLLKEIINGLETHGCKHTPQLLYIARLKPIPAVIATGHES